MSLKLYSIAYKMFTFLFFHAKVLRKERNGKFIYVLTSFKERGTFINKKTVNFAGI